MTAPCDLREEEREKRHHADTDRYGEETQGVKIHRPESQQDRIDGPDEHRADHEAVSLAAGELSDYLPLSPSDDHQHPYTRQYEGGHLLPSRSMAQHDAGEERDDERRS